MSKTTINTTPDVKDVWSGIGGHFDNLGQIINEFVDNSVSNFEGHNPLNKQILISLIEQANEKVEVQIEDTGTGISNLESAFTLGHREDIPDSPLNEHGFGLKHALATANPNNDAWSVCTRSEDDFAKGCYKRISAPYALGELEVDIIDVKETPWPGQYNGSGTLINFVCARNLYNTLVKGIKGGLKDFRSIASVLCEDLGFVYSGIINRAGAIITIDIRDIKGLHEHHNVGAVMPNWDQYFTPGCNTTTRDLGNGLVTIDYAFGIINKSPSSNDYDFDNTKPKKYYQCTMSTSGIEIRINGRLLCYNLFKEVWGIEKHNYYNPLIIRIDLQSKYKDALPKTRTSKNGFREGDDLLADLYTWIRTMCSEPPKSTSFTVHETERFKILCENLNKYNKDTDHLIVTEKHAFTKTGNDADKTRIDLYQFINNKLTIYEGKVGKTTIKDVYQLRMYWDGLVFDGIIPNKGIIVADEHPDSVKDMVSVVNTLIDSNGNHYNFTCELWTEHLDDLKK